LTSVPSFTTDTNIFLFENSLFFYQCLPANFSTTLEAIDRHGEIIRNITWDYAHKVGDLVAELASKHSSVIVLEDLENLREQ